jgi:hypothetical protein
VTLHQRTHPGLDQPNCFGCKIVWVQLAPSATPNRRVGAHAARCVALDRQWDKDMAAYRRLRADGLQPQRIDGAHALERDASTPIQVEYGVGSPQARVEAAFGADAAA